LTARGITTSARAYAERTSRTDKFSGHLSFSVTCELVARGFGWARCAGSARRGLMSELMRAIGHDLQQPLQALVLYLEALSNRTEGKAAEAELVRARLCAEELSLKLRA